MSVPHLPSLPPRAHPPVPERVRAAGPRTLLRAALVGLALLVLVVLLAGCGGAPLPAAERSSVPPASPVPPPGPVTPSTTAPSTTAGPTTAPSTTDPLTTAPSTGPSTRAPARPSTGAGTTTPAPGTDRAPEGSGRARAAPPPATRTASLMWPATDQASARDLQQQADRGGDPWLLDPEEVAISYVGVELGYRNPRVQVLAPDRIDIRDGRSAGRALLELRQPVRTGPGGIWVVTAVTRH